MILAFVAVGVTGACVWASARRLAFAVAPTEFDPVVMLHALRGAGGRDAIELAIGALDEQAWERSLVSALGSPVGQRAALLNEALGELDLLVHRWARVPRVCASVASTSSFMLASMALRAGLTASGDVADAGFASYLNATMLDAVNVAAVGVAGAAFCIAAQYRARRAAKAHLEAADKFVAALEAAPEVGFEPGSSSAHAQEMSASSRP